MTKTKTHQLLEQLISCPSITPNDAGCQKIISERLTRIGFNCEFMPFEKVENLWASYGSGAPYVAFAGHTDVVPPGPELDWLSPAFQPVVRDNLLYGRGASDMKSAIAAMIIATEQFITDYPRFPGTIALLITSDEEGDAHDGTQKVMHALQDRHEKINYCIVGEPSSDQQVGDQIRIGRRGSLHGKLVVHGKQGHVAHPHLALNPIHTCLLALHELAHTEWDQGNQDFPPSTFQITNINAGTGAKNVIPGHIELLFNFRYSTAVTIPELKGRTAQIFKKHGLNFHIEWKIGAEPFLTRKGKLLNATQEAIKAITNKDPKLSTGGGTSDARFIAPTGAEVVELGVSCRTAHSVNECVLLNDLEILTKSSI